MIKLRNPRLYRRLCTVFGEANVGLHRPGEAGVFVKGTSTYNGAGRLTKTAGEDVGEEYNVPCLACGENRVGKEGRLWFNHLWGTRDPFTGGTILWLCHCYNEECQASYTNRRMFAEKILESAEPYVVQPAEQVVKVRRKAVMPGGTQSLRYLAGHDIRHPAVQFCIRKGYDPRELSDKYGVEYCLSPRSVNSLAANRLIVPFYKDEEGVRRLAGWTARKLIQDGAGDKWVHSPNPTGGIVYGLDEASQHPVIVIVEGPGDRWAVGPQAAAMLGKNCGPEKVKKIVMAMQAHGDEAKIVILLDPAQDHKARLRKQPHHIWSAVVAFQKASEIPVYDVWLPRWSDPGSLARSYIWKHIDKRLTQLPR